MTTLTGPGCKCTARMYQISRNEHLYIRGAGQGGMCIALQEALGRLPYLIAVDTGQRAVVLAVRGTSSLSDALTDAIAQPCDLLAGWLGRRAQARTGLWSREDLQYH